MQYLYESYARVVGDMPPYYKVPYAIWGKDCDFDSDGDASHREDLNWRELDARLRPHLTESISIHYPTSDKDLILLQATSESTLKKTVQFLLSQGSIQLQPAQ